MRAQVAIYMFDHRLTTREFFARFDERSTQNLEKLAVWRMIRFVMKAANRHEVTYLADEFVKVFDIGALPHHMCL
jgi:hypothetical protein